MALCRPPFRPRMGFLFLFLGARCRGACYGGFVPGPAFYATPRTTQTNTDRLSCHTAPSWRAQRAQRPGFSGPALGCDRGRPYRTGLGCTKPEVPKPGCKTRVCNSKERLRKRGMGPSTSKSDRVVPHVQPLPCQIKIQAPAPQIAGPMRLKNAWAII